MTSIQQLIVEIKGVRNFFKSRATISSTHSDTGMEASLAESLLSLMKPMKSITPSEASRMLDALHDKPYGEEQTQRIKDALDTLVKQLHTAADIQSSANGHGKQSIKCVWHYGTRRQVDFMIDARRSWASKIATAVEICMSVGCTEPDEQGFKWVLAMLLGAHYAELPPAQAIYDKLQEVKRAFESEKKPFPLERLSEFPDDPADLPSHIYKHAYPDDDDTPVPLCMPGINTVGDSIPLRSSSKLLRQTRPQGAVEAFTAIRKGVESRIAAHQSPVRLRVKTEPHASPITPLQPSPSHGVITVSEQQSELLCNDCKHILESFHAPHANSPPAAQPVYITANAALVESDKDQIVKAESPGTILLSRSAGRIVLTPRTEFPEQLPSVKSEVNLEAVLTDAEPEDAVVAAEDDLDEYTRAAVKTLHERANSKKQEAALRRKGLPVSKKPAAPPGSVKTESTSAPEAAPTAAPSLKRKAKAEPVEIHEVSTANIVAAMPTSKPSGSNPSPVHYNGGVIYTSWSKCAFRALTTRGDVYTEKSKKWASQEPCVTAWKHYVNAINGARK